MVKTVHCSVRKHDMPFLLEHLPMNAVTVKVETTGKVKGMSLCTPEGISENGVTATSILNLGTEWR